MSFCEPARVVTVTSLTPHMRRISIEAEGDWHWPTGGQGDERIDLEHYLRPQHEDAEGMLHAWAQQFVRSEGPTATRDMLAQMNQHNARKVILGDNTVGQIRVSGAAAD